jgi:hypothetical protein
MHYNAGVRQVAKVGTLKNYGDILYCEDAIAKILSLMKMMKCYPVKLDSVKGKKVMVIQPQKKSFSNRENQACIPMTP